MDKQLLDSIEQTLKLLESRINSNFENHKKNNLALQKEIQKSPYSENARDLKELNRDILNENNQIINIQGLIRKYLTEYRLSLLGEQIKPNVVVYDADELFEQTIEGKIIIDEEYPGLENSDFMERLLEYYMVNEDYETCHKLSNLAKVQINKNAA